MSDYRLPMDADGVKYHGTVDQNEENPGQFMYGLDENGNKRIIRTDENGNVLTRQTGSKGEYVTFFEREVRTENTSESRLYKPEGVKGFNAYLIINGITGTFQSNEGVRLRISTGYRINRYVLSETTNWTSASNRLHVITTYPGIQEGNIDLINGSSVISMSNPALRIISLQIEIDGEFTSGEGIDCEVVVEWLI